MLFLFQIVSNHLNSQTILSSGDIVVTYYQFKPSDEIQLLLLKDIEIGTTIYITDAGYMPISNQLRKGEGYLKFVATKSYQKGENILYPIEPGFTKIGVDGFYGLNQTGDQVTIFQGSYENPQFIFSLNVSSEPWIFSDAITNTNSGLPIGLQDGITALSLTNLPVGVIHCTVNTNINDITYFTSPINWTQNTDATLLSYSNCNFTILKNESIITFDNQKNESFDVSKFDILSIEIYDIHGKKVYVCNNINEVYDILPSQQLFLIKVIQPSSFISYKFIKQ
jgi:hypothetical protein